MKTSTGHVEKNTFFKILPTLPHGGKTGTVKFKMNGELLPEPFLRLEKQMVASG